jgi:opacity protein-like surface antigen
MRLIGAFLVALTLAVPARAQVPQASNDFLFGQPHMSVAVRGGWLFARAGSDLFGFVSDRLTLDKGDFNTPIYSTDVGMALSSRIDLVGGFEFARMESQSEYRHFAENGVPIRQTTSLHQQNVSATLRVALAPRGQTVSRLAWVPRRTTPYVGAGVGALHYALRQAGDFVDEDPAAGLAIFTDALDSNGWSPSAHVLGGVDVQLYRGLMLNVEGRYLWSSGPVGDDFVGFDPIDLAGFRLATGVNILF